MIAETKMTTWRDVSERDQCLVRTPIRVVDRPDDVQQRYIQGVWPWCFRRQPGCKTTTINRGCLTRSQHTELLATPRGYTWTGLRGLSEVMERCEEPSPLGNQSRPRRDNINEHDYSVKIVTEALKNQNKTSLNKIRNSKNFKRNRNSKRGMTTALHKGSSSDVINKISMITKSNKKFKKHMSKTVINGTPIKTFHKTTKKLNSSQKSTRNIAKTLNEDTSSEIKNKTTTKSKQEQTNKKYNTETVVKSSKMQQKTAKQLKPGQKISKDKTNALNKDTTSETKNKIATKPKQEQNNKKDNTKIAVKASRIQQKTAKQLKAGQSPNKVKTKALNGESSSVINHKNAPKSKQGLKNKKDNTKIAVKASRMQQKTAKQLKPFQKTSKDKTKALNGESSSVIKHKNAPKSKQGQKNKKDNTKIAVKASRMQQKTAKQLKPGQKTNIDKTEALNGTSSAEIKNDNATILKPDKNFENNTTKTGIEIMPLNTQDQNTNVNPDQKFKNDTTKAIITPSKTQDQTASESPDQIFNDDTAKTGTKVTPSKTQDQTTQEKKLSLRDFLEPYKDKLKKKPRQTKRRFVFQRPNKDETTKKTESSDTEKKLDHCKEPEQKGPSKCETINQLFQFEEKPETETDASEDEDSCPEKKARPLFKNIFHPGCANDDIQESEVLTSSNSANTTCNQYIRYLITKLDGSEYILNKVTSPHRKHNNS